MTTVSVKTSSVRSAVRLAPPCGCFRNSRSSCSVRESVR